MLRTDRGATERVTRGTPRTHNLNPLCALSVPGERAGVHTRAYPSLPYGFSNTVEKEKVREGARRLGQGGLTFYNDHRI